MARETNRTQGVTSQAKIMYRPDVCNCTMPYVPRTVPAYAIPDPAYTAEVFALTLVDIDVGVSEVSKHLRKKLLSFILALLKIPNWGG